MRSRSQAAREAAYVEFVTARQTDLRRLAYARCRDWEQAEEILQGALTKLYVAWPRLERDGTEEAFVRRIVMPARLDSAYAGAGRRQPLQDGARMLPAEERGVVVLDRWLGLGVEDPAEEPPHPPVEARLDAGRRALRRRRRWGLGATAALLLAAAVGPLALRSAGGGAGPRIDLPTPGPTAVDEPTLVHLLVAPPRYVRPDTPPVLYLYGRMFKRDTNVKVLGTYGAIDVSTQHPQGAAIVRTGGVTSWVVVVGNEPERVVVEKVAPYDYQRFMGWAQLEMPLLSGHLALAATAPGPFAQPVSAEDSPAGYAGDRLVAKAGGTVVQRIRHPLANADAVPACHAQAIQVDTPGGGWFVVGFDCRALSDVYSERVGVRADTLSAWLTQVKRVQDAYVG